MPGIDLHTHTTASDGSLAPRELVLAAKAAGLEAVAVTDHDTVAGLAEALAAGAEVGLEVIPGCEVAAEFTAGQNGRDREIHILGLWLPAAPGRLAAVLDELVTYRHNRNHIIIEKLRELGCDVTYEAVKDLAGEGSVGRPHIARLLMDKGYVKGIQEAFDRYLGSKGRAYAPKKVLSPGEAIALLKAEGATVLLAHPGMMGLSAGALEAEVRRLVDLGLDGLEAYYSEHSPTQTKLFLRLAREMDLAVSGGSDFHGTPKPYITLGRGRGDLRISRQVLDDLKARRAKQGLPVPVQAEAAAPSTSQTLAGESRTSDGKA